MLSLFSFSLCMYFVCYLIVTQNMRWKKETFIFISFSQNRQGRAHTHTHTLNYVIHNRNGLCQVCGIHHDRNGIIRYEIRMQKKDNERRETKNAIIYITFVDIETHMRNATGKNIHRNGNLVHVCVCAWHFFARLFCHSVNFFSNFIYSFIFLFIHLFICCICPLIFLQGLNIHYIKHIVMCMFMILSPFSWQPFRWLVFLLSLCNRKYEDEQTLKRNKTRFHLVNGSNRNLIMGKKNKLFDAIFQQIVAESTTFIYTLLRTVHCHFHFPTFA